MYSTMEFSYETGTRCTSFRQQTKPSFVGTEYGLGISDLRQNDTYVKIYINWASNLVTGIIPLVTLAMLNYLVYKHLVKRRNEINNTFDSMSKFRR